MDETFGPACLGAVEVSTKQELGQVLWKWNLCGQCTAKPSCDNPTCPWTRKNCLEAFWNTYEKTTDKSALSSHKEFVTVIEKISDRPSIPRESLIREIFNGVGGTPDHDQNRAFSIAASVLILMNFGILHDAANITSGNIQRTPWRDAASFTTFIEEAFPCRSSSSKMQSMFPELKAKRLKKHTKLRLKPTNDIRRHLVMNKKDKRLWVFHQTTALRQLRATTEDGTIDDGTADDDAADAVVASSILPRDMMLEVLHTIHAVLFPFDPASQKLLRRLVEKSGWDKGLLSDMSVPYRKGKDPPVTFKYFGSRLQELYEELESPTPHVLTATMYGVAAAVSLGFFSLVAAIFQSWVAWQQWKHPVN
jgi:hypothetical protein